jgi:hypothetical protein
MKYKLIISSGSSVREMTQEFLSLDAAIAAAKSAYALNQQNKVVSSIRIVDQFGNDAGKYGYFDYLNDQINSSGCQGTSKP